MYEELMGAIKRPSLWQRSVEPFWDDTHISKMMLEAHLNPDTDAASRRPEFIERSVRWLSDQIPPRGKILDLGCGPGLYTKRLSEMGYDVTGVDLSRRSIGYARENDPKTRYICRDYLTLDETDEYDAVTLIYCDYAALTPLERANLLMKIRRMLKPDGSFIFDVFTDAHNLQKEETAQWYACENGGFWSAEPHICMEAAYLYENNTVCADQYVVITKDAVKEYIIWDTAYSRERLYTELRSSGFVMTGVYGDVCGAEYTGQSETLCCIAAKE